MLGKLKLERYLSPWILQMQQMQMQADEAFEAEHTPFMKRLPSITKDALGIVRGVILYVLLGIFFGTVAFMIMILG